jgi:hypothetical protein
MNQTLVDRVVQAVLYEGYILYPYRPALKNQQRWTFGVLLPRYYCLSHQSGDHWIMRTECLVNGNEQTTLDVTVRFLHLIDRQGWQEAVERSVCLTSLKICDLLGDRRKQCFAFPECRVYEPLQGGSSVVRQQQAIEGEVSASAARTIDGLIKVTVKIKNDTPLRHQGQGSRDEALMKSLVSTHTILGVQGGEFISLLDPPDDCREAVAACQNNGTWPVLVGEHGVRDTLLSSPIILYDYPQIAPESHGDLFDATEIDEILSLRILTLTSEEKLAMAAVDEHGKELLRRIESLSPQELSKLHGTMRGFEDSP